MIELETAKKLKEAGFPQKTDWAHPSFEEIWEELPAKIRSDDSSSRVGYLELMKNLSGVHAGYYSGCEHGCLIAVQFERNPTEAAAQLWLKLKGEGMV